MIDVDGLTGPVQRRIRVLLVRQTIEQQATALLDAAEGTVPDRLHRHVAGRLMLLTAGACASEWMAAYGLAKLAAGVYRHASAVLHGRRAFADVPEILVCEWEQVAKRLRGAVDERQHAARS